MTFREAVPLPVTSPHRLLHDLHRRDALRGQLDNAVERRFWRNVDPSGDCWEWLGALNGKQGNYGIFGFQRQGKSTRSMAHRLAYRLLVGEIPAGHGLDHLCFNRRCVNPDHLEPVLPRENVRRARHDGSRVNAAKSHCPQGHPYAGDNLLVGKQSTPRAGLMRICRQCHRTAERLAYHRRKGQVKA